MGDPVIQAWVFELPWKEQTVMLLALRGCDNSAKHDAGKEVTRAMRGVVLHNANKVTSFIRPDLHMLDMDRCEGLPVHWMMHTIHAAEVIGYRHPDMDTRRAWHAWYLDAIHKLHVQPESMEAMQLRLKGENGPQLDWDSMHGKGFGTGGR